MKDGKKVNVLCIVDRNHERSVVVIDHFRSFKSIQLKVEYNTENEDGILIQGKGNYCSKSKKGKIKMLLKITRYIRRTRALSTMNRASLKLRKHVFTKTWQVAVISENKQVPSGFHARDKNPKQQHLKVVKFSNSSFSIKHIKPR